MGGVVTETLLNHTPFGVSAWQKDVVQRVISLVSDWRGIRPAYLPFQRPLY